VEDVGYSSNTTADVKNQSTTSSQTTVQSPVVHDGTNATSVASVSTASTIMSTSGDSMLGFNLIGTADGSPSNRCETQTSACTESEFGLPTLAVAALCILMITLAGFFAKNRIEQSKTVGR
jgi:hypothetical protein